MSYEGEIFEPIIGIGDKSSIPQGNIPGNYNNINHIFTLLVSGDTKPPADYIKLSIINQPALTKIWKEYQFGNPFLNVDMLLWDLLLI